MTNAQSIAKSLIIEAQQAGPTEMRIRRCNRGIAGRIATKITLREQWDENNERLDIEQQSELLALRLSDEELQYAAEMLRIDSKKSTSLSALKSISGLLKDEKQFQEMLKDIHR
jgi:hypothetical protein